MLYEGHRYCGFKDPDNYGLNHDYCGFLTDLDTEVLLNFPDEEINHRRNNQEKLLRIFTSMITDEKVHQVLQTHIHFKGSGKSPLWSNIEEFRYLETLYNFNPTVFHGNLNEKIEYIKSEFYKNQPFILNLPMEK